MWGVTTSLLGYIWHGMVRRIEISERKLEQHEAETKLMHISFYDAQRANSEEIVRLSERAASTRELLVELRETVRKLDAQLESLERQLPDDAG